MKGRFYETNNKLGSGFEATKYVHDQKNAKYVHTFCA
jgi:hypothetical protein